MASREGLTAFQAIVSGRRSVRSFEDRPVPRELVEGIIEAGRHAPSSGNTQPWHFYVVTAAAAREALVKATYPGSDCTSPKAQEWVGQAPVIIVACLDWRRGAAKYNYEHRYFIGPQDVASAIQSMLLAAEAAGLGACWVGGIRFTEVAEALGIPPVHEPLALIPVGYARHRPGPKRLRPMDEVATWL